MKEYMLIIHSMEDLTETLPIIQRKEFLRKVQDYIENLKKEGKLKGAQPLEREGRIISGTMGAFKDEPFLRAKEVIVGYYHILANDIFDAITIAKGNPEFEYGTTARIEIRPLKLKEELIDYVYQ
jgi:hypothetical protein